MLDTQSLLANTNFPTIQRGKLETLQVNLGYLCNLSCVHCHVNAGPRRTELMDRKNIDTVLAFIERRSIQSLDLTGGSPEMNSHFKYLVTEARRLGAQVMDRCNPTILLEPGYEDYAQFLADHQVIVTASLPCYSEQNVDQQRGKGVFKESIKALQSLNQLGYGRAKTGLILNLVYNPTGPFLPPPQQILELDYKRALHEQYGIEFNQLFALANMPISRFGSTLLSKGQFSGYLKLLKDSFQPGNLATLMCRSLISVDWQGFVYDCDFNQMLKMPLLASDKPKTHLKDLMEVDITGGPIAVADHCYGCTAGQGSSCGGALS